MADVVIVGAGPAGLALACYLTRAGVPCLVLERAHHPRPHVGESLMPSALPVLEELGFLPVMEAAGFTRSGGVVYHDAKGRGRVELPYAELADAAGAGPESYHVDRSRMDLLLLKHAESLGCRIVQGASVSGVDVDGGGRVTGVRCRVGGQPLEIPASVVVDAAGRGTLLGRHLGLRRDHAVLDQFALHAWFEGVERGRRKTRNYTHVFFLPQIRGWAWQAPISDDITSIGVVADRRAYQLMGERPEEFLRSAAIMNDALAEAMEASRRINDLKGEVNYSYRLDRVCGDGWMAVGDAARFIDPVFSSGVAMALRGARYAAHHLGRALEKGPVTAESLGEYESTIFADTAVWDDFIRLFYRLLPAFTHLLESYEHRPTLLGMIQGRIGSESDRETLAAMRALVRAVEEADDHPWKADLMDVPDD